MIKVRNLKLNLNIWSILSFIFILLVILPNLNILINIFKEPNENWIHIKKYLLKDYIINSLTLILFTGLFTILIGISLSWLISVYDFPFRSFFKWSLILPLAFPPYIASYTYNGILNYTGIIQTFLRNNLNIQVNQKYFDIMSMKGAVFIFTMFLFPYVYIITRSFLEKQSSSLIENARVLGRNSFEIFLHIVLPISRGAIVGGASLVILEVLNDYGVVSYFGIPTFSTAIFKTWFSMGDMDSSVKLSSILMLIVFCILILEKFLRGRKRFSYTTTKIRPISRIKLEGIKGYFACIFCFIFFSLGFLIPTLQLLYWSLLTYKKILSFKFFELILNSFFIASFSALLVIIIAVIIANYCRINNSLISKIYSKTTLIGYSIPAAVIAISVILLFINLDNKLYWIYKIINNNSKKLVLSTSIVMLIFAYLIRFLAIGYNSVESGFEKVGTKFYEASRMLGMSITETFFKVDLKMIKPAILSGFLLVFVDILKELPLTLILRPFNFNTLATKVFEYANDEMIHEASIASLIIVIISFISIYFFYKIGDKED
ncbi:ABC transporter permease [Tepidibacter formicigenes]|uniref:Iron(III) transport system permease protein n=1 Tax=Tepidibacter formicigenes DSM 15518 TaxID=1123349 RepID=A0A1M6S9R6_9FIRM|nr:iron ABC transporter permease [Tepidibacter formicigenes]SHK41421.1 iron(III) transport system permease protein [Tepidibacter formicigenes DSM 15518]